MLTINTIRPTRIEINLAAIKYNIQLIKEIITPGCAILLPVKADAYGHGAVAVARYSQQEGIADMFGVASVEEGIELRENGITSPILVLGAILPDQTSAEAVLRYNLIQSVSDMKVVKALSNAACKLSGRPKVHIKTDTGMQRLGIDPGEVLDFAEKISADQNLQLAGLFSHMPVSDDKENDFNEKQITQFSKIVNSLKAKNPGLCVHLSNSATIVNYRNADFSMVRPGIFAYGYSPVKESSLKPVPAMKMLSSVIATKRVAAGTAISYGHSYVTRQDCFISTIPVGYGDGYPRCLSNKAQVMIAGKTYPVAGRICMDLMMIDCGNDEYACGTDVELFGDGLITAETLATLAGTIPYEITCAPSRRVPRTY